MYKEGTTLATTLAEPRHKCDLLNQDVGVLWPALFSQLAQLESEG